MTRLILAFTLLLVGCSERLHGSLSEREANEILAALSTRGIEGKKDKEASRGAGTFEVRVARRELARALAVLDERGLPREATPSLEALLGEGGLVPSERGEEAKLARVMQAELSETLRRMEGVVDARVHVALPRKPGVFEATPERPRAAVFLKTRGAPTYDEAAVRALVAGGVRNLSAEDVEVVSMEAAASAAAEAAPSARVGPFEVAPDSAMPLRITLTLCVISLLALTTALFAIVLRSRRNSRPETSH